MELDVLLTVVYSSSKRMTRYMCMKRYSKRRVDCESKGSIAAISLSLSLRRDDGIRAWPLGDVTRADTKSRLAWRASFPSFLLLAPN